MIIFCRVFIRCITLVIDQSRFGRFDIIERAVVVVIKIPSIKISGIQVRISCGSIHFNDSIIFRSYDNGVYTTPRTALAFNNQIICPGFIYGDQLINTHIPRLFALGLSNRSRPGTRINHDVLVGGDFCTYDIFIIGIGTVIHGHHIGTTFIHCHGPGTTI